MKAEITYFENASQSVKTITFEGDDANQEAQKWAKENLENYNSDIIKLTF